MAMTMKESVVHWRKKLEKENITDDKMLRIMDKLEKIPISIDLLEETHIGKCVRKISKRSDFVGEKALAILRKWRVYFAGCDSSKKPKKSSKKENVKKHGSSSKSSAKHDISNGNSYKKNASHSEHKPKHQRSSSSTSHSLEQSSKYINSDYNVNPSKESSPSIYTYEKKEAHTKYMDYDPHVDISEGYNPECPELYPGSSKSVKLKKSSDSLIDTYEPSSVKRKLNPEPQTESKNKYKKQKSESRSSADSVCVDQAKHSERKEGNNFQKSKNKDHKSHTTDEKKKFNDKHQLHSDSKEKSPSDLIKKSKTKDSSDKSNSSVKSKGKLKINCTEEFTSSEVRFEDCLGFNDIVTVKKKKVVKSQSGVKSQSALKSQSTVKSQPAVKSESSSKKPLSTSNNSNKIHANNSKEEKVPKEKLNVNIPRPSAKLDDVDIISTLPQTQPIYRPLPQRSLDASPKKKMLTNEEAIKFTSSRREKTAVYSGRKSFFTEVPSLFEFCTRVLIENIDAIEYMGEVPYFLLKPVLERCNPTQLYSIENFNPYLLDDTNELWEVHCKRDYKLLAPQENETWRELYLRAFEERERRLKSVTANISASMSKSNPVRQVKLAYVDSVAKPPRDVARRQAKHGTALPVSHPMKAGPATKSSPRPIAPAINAAASSSSTPIFIPKKPKVAPLMAKTLKSMKQCFRRK